MYQAAFVALGSNLPSPAGSPSETLRSALSALDAADGLRLLALSGFYRTPAFPPGSGPDFVNAVAAFDCTLTPGKLLAVLHDIEALHSRSRDTRWGARSLDLDLLAMGDTILPSRETWQHWHDLPLAEQTKNAPGELILPHPRLQDRAFVLVPLAEIAPDWRHPVLGTSVTDLLALLPAGDISEVVRL